MSYEVNFLFSKPFMKKWFKCGLSLDEREELKNEILQYLSNSPINTYGKKFPGVVVEGTGGAFKYRFTPKNYHKGKSGSFRTIYFIYNANKQNLFFLEIYPKNKKSTLSVKEKKSIKNFIKEFRYSKRKNNYDIDN